MQFSAGSITIKIILPCNSINLKVNRTTILVDIELFSPCVEESMECLRQSGEAAVKRHTAEDGELGQRIQDNQAEQEELRRRLQQLQQQENELKEEREAKRKLQERAEQVLWWGGVAWQMGMRLLKLGPTCSTFLMSHAAHYTKNSKHIHSQEFPFLSCVRIGASAKIFAGGRGKEKETCFLLLLHPRTKFALCHNSQMAENRKLVN